MNKTSKKKQYQSQTGFVLVHGGSKIEEPVTWEWLTHRNFKQQPIRQQQVKHPRLSYQQKKSILQGLDQKQRRITSSFKIRDGFSRKQRVRIFSTASTCSKSEKKVYPSSYINSNQGQANIPSINLCINQQQFAKKAMAANNHNNNIVALMSVRRHGLRYKISHAFVEYCPCNKTSHNHHLKDLALVVKQQIKQYSNIQRELYYFNLDTSPIHHYSDLSRNQFAIIFVDLQPKLDLGEILIEKILAQAEIIKQIFNKYGVNASRQSHLSEQPMQSQSQEQKYDWQKIKNVKNYADTLTQDPQINKLPMRLDKKDELLSWYNQSYNNGSENQQINKSDDKNLLFESKTHYPNEISNKKLLNLATKKVEELPNTNNIHKYLPQKIDLLMELVKRQSTMKQDKQHSIVKALQNNFQPPVCKRDMIRNLDKKNSLLLTQNIPYLIEKYGLNRFEIYNLYNLYKSFQKIALMRNPSKTTFKQVLKQGIDRQTFEVGLKGLDMNPGDELIRNICHFGDFISWQQFIKIISISLRKTPEQKLSAILKGISSFDDGYLTRHQISLMIGNSLMKLFDRQQTELKQYFTEMAMKEFDKSNTQKVSTEVLKQKILGKGSQNLTMVSFLILNT